MGKFSSQKGAAFERRVAKMFSAAWNVKLLRTPQSGGWGHAQTKGDLVLDPTVKDVTFPYFVECKNEQGYDLWSAIYAGTGPIEKWWMKASQQAYDEGGKEPLLIIGHDQKPPLLITRADSNLLCTPCSYVVIADQHLVILCLSDFLELKASCIKSV